MSNLKNFKEKILLKILIIFLLVINLYFVSAQSLSYTTFKSSNKEFVFRYPTQWGDYNFKITADLRSNELLPTLWFYSTNTSNSLNKYSFLIRAFYGRSDIYSYKTNIDNNGTRTIIIDLIPPASGNPNGSINFYHYRKANEGGHYVNYAKIYGDISDLIEIYTCEDDEWRDAGGTCLGVAGNPSSCFNAVGLGEVIHDGLLMGGDDETEAGLTICIRKNY